MSAPATSVERPSAPQPRPVGTLEAIRLVARREFVTRTGDRSFLISTAVTVLIIVGVVVGPRLFGGGPASYDVAVSGDQAAALADAIATTGDAVELDVTAQAVTADRATLAEQVAAGDLDAAVVGDEIVVDSELPTELETVLQQASRDVRIAAGLEAAGVPPEAVPQLLAPPPLTVATLQEVDDEESSGTEGLAFFATFILYGQVLGYGFTVAGGVVEEKSTRVVEVLLSTLRPSQLLAGKIIGVGLVGLAQLLLLAVLALGIVLLTGVVELPPGAVPTIGMVFLWFLLGYAFYACLFGVAGSLVSRQEELGNVTTPLMLLVLVGFFAAIGALNDPGSTLARVLSFVPPTAPMVMPVRVAFGEATPVEIVGAVAVTAAAAALLIPLAGRLYTGAVLRTGGRVKLAQAWRSGTEVRP